MTHHPNVHQAWQGWSNEETLHIAVVYSNPFRWHSRRRLFHDFIQQFKHHSNVKLYVGELAFGDRPFELGQGEGFEHIKLRTNSELFHKENVINLVAQRFDPDWKYGGYIDGDFTFTRHDWALEAIHRLQHHDFVQLFSSYTNLTSGHKYGGRKSTSTRRGFAATFIENGHQLPSTANPGGWAATTPLASLPYGDGANAGTPDPKWVPVGATGGAWAWTRQAFNTVGGLMDRCILGHADWFMTFGLVGEHARGMHDDRYHPNYVHHIQTWQEKAAQLKGNIGYVDQFVVHNFHGHMKNRGYETRDQILVKYQFDPVADLRPNWQGIYELTGNKPALRDAVRRYFMSRDEDSTEE